MSDPRVFFAAERTLLAWIRTGLTIMGFGFVVARFGLFLTMLAAVRVPATALAPSSSHFSTGIGIVLVLLGAASMFFAATQYRSFVATLPAVDVPPLHRHGFHVAFAVVLGTIGLLLAVYLAF